MVPTASGRKPTPISPSEKGLGPVKRIEWSLESLCKRTTVSAGKRSTGELQLANRVFLNRRRSIGRQTLSLPRGSSPHRSWLCRKSLVCLRLLFVSGSNVGQVLPPSLLSRCTRGTRTRHTTQLLLSSWHTCACWYRGQDSNLHTLRSEQSCSPYGIPRQGDGQVGTGGGDRTRRHSILNTAALPRFAYPGKGAMGKGVVIGCVHTQNDNR